MTNEEIKTLLVDFYSKIDENTCSMFDLNMKNSILDIDGNLKEYISEKVLGTALYSVFNAIKKTRDEQARKKLAELNACDEFFGKVGDKFKGYSLHVTLVKTISFESNFGTVNIWIMKDKDGHEIVWKTGTTPYYETWNKMNTLKCDIRDYVETKYDEYNINEAIDNHSDDEKLLNMYSEIERLYNLCGLIDNGSPIEFDIVGGSIKEHKVYTNKDGVSTKQTVVTRCKLDNFMVA